MTLQAKAEAKLKTQAVLEYEPTDRDSVIQKLKGHLVNLHPIILYDKDYDLNEMMKEDSEFVIDLIKTAHAAITNLSTPLNKRTIDTRYYSNLRLLYENAIRIENSPFTSQTDELLSLLVKIDGVIGIINSVHKLLGDFERKLFNLFASEDQEETSLLFNGKETQIKTLINWQFMAISTGDDRYLVDSSEEQRTAINEYFENVKAEYGLSSASLDDVMRIARLDGPNGATIGDAFLLIKMSFVE